MNFSFSTGSVSRYIEEEERVLRGDWTDLANQYNLGNCKP